MSVVTGVILIIGAGDWGEGPLTEVQGWLSERHKGQQLSEIAEVAGGWKHPQFEAWAGGFNYFLDDEDFVRFVMSREWYSPENVVLVMQPEDGETRVFRPTSFPNGGDHD